MNLYYTLGIIYLFLIGSSMMVRLPYFSPNHELRQRVNTWWIMVVVFSLALIISKNDEKSGPYPDIINVLFW